MDRFFDEQHRLLFADPRQQVLGALENEIPAQMRQDDERGRMGWRHRRLGLKWVAWAIGNRRASNDEGE
jgi:hypothetical protein